jgi:hypothetical protein
VTRRLAGCRQGDGEAAIRELIAGPLNGLQRLVSADAALLGIRIDNGLATVNFDRDPGGLFVLRIASTRSQRKSCYNTSTQPRSTMPMVP